MTSKAGISLCGVDFGIEDRNNQIYTDLSIENLKTYNLETNSKITKISIFENIQFSAENNVQWCVREPLPWTKF